ncbi:serine/threonine protein phosphatase [Paenibacillus albicereus]|uniref:Serine/threonine protein phosphatase n=2 Tax=Paenibacillus albicereus TaxID=2726185 RepID=A0A6H2H4D2_9BACL|nr:serine/threonine protein phosphatase [Paenibacillus albicereus]
MQLLAVPTGSGTPGGGAEAPASLAMTFSGDPASSRAFAWYTPSAVTGTRLEIVEGTYTDATWPSAAATSIAGTSQSIQAYASSSDKSAGKKTSYVSHKATATGLKPGTTYSYRAGDGTSGRWSAVGTFRTAESSPSSYSFLFTTDPQGTTESEFVTWNHTLTEGMAKFPDARFVAVTGDLVDNGDLESQWGWVLGKPAELLRRLPLAPAVGNHESKSYSNFGWHFNLPDTGTGAQPAGSVYSFDYGPAHFMVLNTEFDEASGSDPIYQKQVAWLRADAAASSKKWKIVLLHKSPYSVANHSSSSDILFFRNNLTKVFDELGIDAVLGGHDHTYTRTYPMKANSPQTNPTLDANGDMVRPNGTLYVTSNAAGDKRYTPKSGPFPYAYKYGQPGKEMFTGVTVSTDRLTFQVYTTTEAGSTALYDRFGIVK